MLDKIREKANTVAPGQWLIGMGWDENLFTEGNIPTIEDLDHAYTLSSLSKADLSPCLFSK